MKRVIVLGSTGSIGTAVLDVIQHYKHEFEIIGLVAKSNISLLNKQVQQFNPKYVGISDKTKASQLSNKQRIKKLFVQEEGILDLLNQQKVDIIVSAIPGFSGLLPTIEALKNCKYLALANKEALVCAGPLLINMAKKYNCKILPVDSEHNSIFQILEKNPREYVACLWITCSGGPCYKKEDLSKVTLKEALSHPTWKMGKKITIDSATLMNKGFEVIEASYLFGISWDRIKVVIHPQSIIHSLVEFQDGTFQAILSFPDMRLPIAYTLFYPKRRPIKLRPRLSLDKLSLNFYSPDFDKFPCITYSYEALKVGGSMPTVLSSADEVAVWAFLQGKITFDKIPELIKKTMQNHTLIKNPSLEDILGIDKWAKQYTKDLIKSQS